MNERPSGSARRHETSVMALWALLLVLGLLWGLTPPRALAQDGVGSYTVVSGDTLSAIAQRFGVTVEAIAQANGIGDPSLIRVGQVLLIPGASSNLAQIPTAQVLALPGESLFDVAQRYGQDATLLTSLNGLSPTARLFPGQPVQLPADQAPPRPLYFGAIDRIDMPAQIIQGRTGRLTVHSARPLVLAANWNGTTVAFVPTNDEGTQQTALLPAPALLGPGVFPLTVTYTADNGVTLHQQRMVLIADGGYERQVIQLPPDRATLLDPVLVTTEEQRVAEVWAQTGATLWASGRFFRPIAEQYQTTSPFGIRRSYNGGPFTSYHAGQDFGAPVGVTVTAPADAVVALAEPLQVRGNAVILDHGRGVYTGYWHLSELLVAPGQAVAAGDLIGLVGNTGLSTGAHLHWELRIYGIAVDPMQFLTEPLLE